MKLWFARIMQYIRAWLSWRMAPGFTDDDEFNDADSPDESPPDFY
jgi:hypothetical protein